ncbi:MAG: serine/threonine-protein kinase [Lysinibacillus sp.]
MNTIQYDVGLNENSILKNTYVIKRNISLSNLSIVYVAENKVTKEEQIIKEFFPTDIALRDLDNMTVINRLPSTKKKYEKLKKNFLNEALIMKGLVHRNIAEYVEHFEENGSIYIVMKYYDGKQLNQYLEDYQLDDRFELCNNIFLKIIDGLNYIHKKGLIHRDIKPSNIIIERDGNPRILDFGSAVYYKQRKKYSIFTTNNFSPIELYAQKSKQRIYTDIYSLSAIFYYALTNIVPVNVSKRLIEDDIETVCKHNKMISPVMSSVIMWGLAVQSKKRCFSLKFFKIAMVIEYIVVKIKNPRKKDLID